MAVRYYSSTAAETTLTGTINGSATSINVGSTVGLPVSFPYTLALDYETASEELVDVTAAAGTNLTVVRAVDSTSGTSHSAGARVRHTSSARDFRDSREHEEDATGVHGVAGALVGTTDVQTLTNKTLSAPVINSATLNGTYTGNPTFTGGADINTNPFDFARALATDIVFTVRVTGDTQDRLVALAGGVLVWGSGTLAGDTNLYRSAANVLKTDDSFSVGQTLAVAGSTTLAGSLNVGTTATVAGNATVGGNLDVVGIGQDLYAYKTGDTSRANTVTTTNDPHLTTTISANSVYKVECAVIYSGPPDGDIAIDWTVPAGAAGFWHGAGYGRAAVDTIEGYTIRMNQNDVDQARTFGALAGVNSVIMIHGTVRTSAAGGTFAMQWAQATLDATPTSVRAESYLYLRRVQ